MAKTHYFAIVGDHWRGRPIYDPTRVDPMQTHVDPLLGQLLTLVAPPTPALAVNVVVSGATSLARGRIVRVIDTVTCIVESWAHPIFGTPGGGFSPGETLNFDTGGTAIAAPGGISHEYPLYGQQALRMQDARLNSFVPNDKSDKPWWDRRAKVARTLLLDSGTGSVLAADWRQGDRCTTSGGAAFTILLSASSGSDRLLSIIRASGTFTAGDTITNTRSSATCDIKTGGVGADTPTGAWVPHHISPNLNGEGVGWELPPNGNGTDGGSASIGQEPLLVRAAHEHFVAKEDVADRGVRFVPFDQRDTSGNTDGVLGGVTVQCIKCTGTFSTAWEIGESVGSGSWTATVHAFNAVEKYLYVRAPNGQTLAAGTLTGETSGATATCTGPALGWQKGSKYFNDLVAEIAASQGAADALWMGSDAEFAGAFLCVWDAEVLTFRNTLGCPWPSAAQAKVEWNRFLVDLRTALGDDDLPLALWHGDARSYASTVHAGGYAYAIFCRAVLEQLQAEIANVRLVRTEGHQPAQTSGLPVTTDMVKHRPADYLEDGFNAWRALQVSLLAPSGNWKYCPLVLVIGQSQQVGDIPAATMMAIDRDPDLWPSSSFPGVNTVDSSCITYNTITGQWEPLDVTLNANHFFGMAPGTAGPPVALMQRMKGRFAPDGAYSGVVGLINLPVSLSSLQANAIPPAATLGAAATWDPAPNNISATVSCTVTAFPASGMLPARARFTATAGTFSAWTIIAPATVSGSALGVQGSGGNNTANYRGNLVMAVAADGSYVDLVGSFVNEGPRTFTLTWGLLPIWAAAKQHIKDAFARLPDLNLIPWPALVVLEQGESDVGLSSTYQAHLEELLDEVQGVFGLRPKGQTPVAEVLVQLSSNTPVGSDSEVAAIRAAQAAVAADRPNAALVDPSRCPMESAGVHPRTSRAHNGLHRTARGHIMAGYLIDEAAGSLEGIPAHPDGAAAIDFGVGVGGSSGTDGAESAGTDAPEGSGAGVDSTTEQTASTVLEQIEAAMSGGGIDVAGYTVNGRTVQNRSLTDLIAAHKYMQAQQQRARGIRRTRVSFQ